MKHTDWFYYEYTLKEYNQLSAGYSWSGNSDTFLSCFRLGTEWKKIWKTTHFFAYPQLHLTVKKVEILLLTGHYIQFQASIYLFLSHRRIPSNVFCSSENQLVIFVIGALYELDVWETSKCFYLPHHCLTLYLCICWVSRSLRMWTSGD